MEVRDKLGERQGGLGRVEGPSKRFRTGRWTLGEVRDRSGEPSGMSETGRGTLGEV